jgi:eukaryotic-like serine/threonine-protein kinase
VAGGRLQRYDASGTFARPEVWLFELATGRWRVLAERVVYPFWSADGSKLAYAALGAPDLISYVGLQPGARAITHGEVTNARGGAWLADGRMVIGRPQGGLTILPVAGGPGMELRALVEGEASWRHPVKVAPGRVASLVLFEKGPGQLRSLDVDRPAEHSVLVPTTRNSAVFDRGVLFYDRDGVPVGQAYDQRRGQLTGEPRAIPFDAIASRVNVGNSQISAGGGHVAVYNQRGGEGSLGVFSRSGARLRTLAQRGVFSTPSVSPDGRRLALVWQRPNSDGSTLWIADLESGAMLQRTFAFDASLPIWHPEGRLLAFRSLQGWAGNGNLYLVDASGATDVDIWYEDLVSMYPAGWTADGSVVWVSDSPSDRAGVFTSRRGQPPVPYLERDGVRDAAVAPRGDLIALRSARSGRDEIYVDTFPTPSGAVRVSPRGGRFPRWRADGREVYFVEGERLMAVAVVTGPVLRVENPEPLFPVPSRGSDPLFAPSPDGQQFYVISDLTPSESSIKMTLDWAASQT